MAERKSGPVKPPILDLEARKSAEDKEKSADAKSSDAKSGQAKAEQAKPAQAGSTGTRTGADTAGQSGATRGKPETTGKAAAGPETTSGAGRRTASEARAKSGSPVAPALIGLAGGAVLGVALGYGIAMLGYWPNPSAGPNPEIAALKTQVAALEQRTSADTSGLSAFNDRVNTLESSAKSEIDQLSKSVAALTRKVDAGQNVDLGPIEQRIGALSDRINAVAAGASSSDAQALSKGMSDNRTAIATLNDDLSGLKTTLSGVSSDVAALNSRVGALENQPPPDANAAAATAVRLPMALSGLESAFANGRAYASELTALTASLPSLSVPPSVAGAQATGLTRPDIVASELHDAIPAMLAAKPVAKGTNWQGVLLDRIKSLLAMRPAGEVQGDTPDALVSRIEAAVGRHDFATARDLFARLPVPMATAAGGLPDKIGALADAYAMIDKARATALAEAPGGAQ